MSTRLDIVLFGATGHTGKYVIRQLDEILKLEELDFTWGIAGRSEVKLKQALDEVGKQAGADLSKIPIIIANVNDDESLKQMTAQARLVINTVGPYRFYGEPVIKACILTSTHHLDVTGEPQYMELMQLKYNKVAMEKGIYLISGCGFDSVPADLGLVYLQNNFNGTLNSVETYVHNPQRGKAISGSSFNYATWESLVHGFAHSNELVSIRSKLYPNRLPEFKPKLKPRANVHKSKIINKWALPFVGSDRSVMLRSQRFFYEHDKARPVQIQSYLGINYFHNVVLMLMLGSIFQKFCKYKFTRDLLLRHPKLFSAGTFSLEPPPRDKVEQTEFELLLDGEGWSEKQADSNGVFEGPPNKRLLARLSGTNPGYRVASSAVVLCAVIILRENDKMPNNGGVYPPAAAFGKTSLVQKLHKHAVKFELLSHL